MASHDPSSFCRPVGVQADIQLLNIYFAGPVRIQSGIQLLKIYFAIILWASKEDGQQQHGTGQPDAASIY